MKKGQYGKNQWKVTLLNLGIKLLIVLALGAGIYFAYPVVKTKVDEIQAKREAAKLEGMLGEDETGDEPDEGQLADTMPQENPNESNPAERGTGTQDWAEDDLGEGDQGEPEAEKIHRYEFVPFDGTWNDALRAAEEAGGYLATITSPEEQQEIEALMEEHDGYYVTWLGANSLSGDFAWVNGEAWEYTNWADGEPNNETGSESYLLMYRVDGVWCWNDVEVSVSTYYKGHMGYIVEHEE